MIIITINVIIIIILTLDIFRQQIISQLNLVVKPHVLLTMFIHCVQTYTECSEGIATMFPFPVYTGIEPLSPTMESPPTSVTSVSGDLKELNSTLSCFIMMLDLLVKQVRCKGFRNFTK
mgnify:CR=1 FL=1